MGLTEFCLMLAKHDIVFNISQSQQHFNNLKLVSTIFYQVFIFSPNDSPSKIMKNIFYFI